MPALPYQMTVGTAAGPVQVKDAASGLPVTATAALCPRGVQLKVDPDNSGKVYLGAAGVTAGTGFRLDPGNGFELSAGNLEALAAASLVTAPSSPPASQAASLVGSASAQVVHVTPL